MLQRFEEEGLLLESGVDELILAHVNKIDELISFAKSRDVFIVTKSLVQEYLGLVNKKVVIERPVYRAIASEYSSNLEHISAYDVEGKSRCTGTVDDFISLFRDRFRRTVNIFRMQSSKYPIMGSTGLKMGGDCRYIAMVRSKTITKNGHMIIEAEDEQGVVKVFISNNNERLKMMYPKLVLDEVVAFDGRYRDPFFYVEDILWPDIPVNKEKKLIEENLSIAFISDVHVGSKLFLEDKFVKMINWLNGEASSEHEIKIASSIKYIFVAGDLVDGIGVYPNQERELSILDIYEQYDRFLSLMENIPEYIEIVFIPGNHDAVRRGDPQPSLAKEFIKRSHSNFHFYSSPSYHKVEGLTLLAYHGNSLDSMIANISGLSYNEPEKVMIDYLKRRHLSPIYGSNHIVPERTDYMLIEEVPDIVHMGHIHKNGYAEYRNVSLINSGTWQDVTEYQKSQGHVPTPARLPVYNLHTGSLSLIDFSEQGVLP
ncbi:MAG: DNA-directed DNA polymerase II small subunit [Candidatus Micrarchaeia archaeon]